MAFYAEWVPFDTDEEKEKAYQYLSLWKKFLLMKLSPSKQIGQDQIILKNYGNLSCEDLIGIEKNKYNFTLGIKIEVENDNDTTKDQEAS